MKILFIAQLYLMTTICHARIKNISIESEYDRNETFDSISFQFNKLSRIYSFDSSRIFAVQNENFLEKRLSNGETDVIIKIKNDQILFEIVKNKKSKLIYAINEFGKLSFSSYSPIVSYFGDSIKSMDHVFYKNKFLIFPFEDWNGNQFFYNIPLSVTSSIDSISPLIILKEQYCIFNQRTGVLLSYKKLIEEHLIDDKYFYTTELIQFHVGGDDDKITRYQFNTQKEIYISEDISIIEFKEQLLSIVNDFYDKSIYEAFFN